jgi:hypothetical protein
VIAMPMQRALYPPEWEQISLRVRERAGWRCEWPGCGLAQGQIVEGARGPYTVVLTVAHLDHTPSHCAEENLRAWCQPHHLRYDVDHHRRSRNRRRLEQAHVDGQLDLWEDTPPAPTIAPMTPERVSATRHTWLRAQHAAMGPRRAKPSESHPSASSDVSSAAGTVDAQPVVTTEPLVWGKWPDAQTPLVVEGDVAARRYVFAGEMACGRERMGVLLVAWEQRGEIGRAEQRWVDVSRVRRVIVGECEREDGESEA